MDKRNKIYVIMCYVCAIICVVALLVCMILHINNLPHDGGTNPPTQSSSSAPSGGGVGGDDETPADDGSEDPEEPTTPETNTDRLLSIIVDSEDVYVEPLSNLIDIDGTLNSSVDENSISAELENVSTRILAELNAKFGTVHEITSAMLDDDAVYNLFEEFENLLINSTK